jgi:hypothetical protein
MGTSSAGRWRVDRSRSTSTSTLATAVESPLTQQVMRGDEPVLQPPAALTITDALSVPTSSMMAPRARESCATASAVQKPEALHKGSEGGGRATRNGRGERRFVELEEVGATRERLEHHERLDTLRDARGTASRVPDGDRRARPCRLGLGLGGRARIGAVGRGCTRQSWRRVGRDGGHVDVRVEPPALALAPQCCLCVRCTHRCCCGGAPATPPLPLPAPLLETFLGGAVAALASGGRLSITRAALEGSGGFRARRP